MPYRAQDRLERVLESRRINRLDLPMGAAGEAAGLVNPDFEPPSGDDPPF